VNYRIRYTPQAEAELNEAADWIAARAPLAGQRWFAQFTAALGTLAENPIPCPLAPE